MTFSIILSELQSAVTDKYLELNEVRSKWNQSMDLAKEFVLLIHNTKIPKICRVKYWSIFLDTVVLVLRDFTRSFRKRDWNTFALFFFFFFF